MNVTPDAILSHKKALRAQAEALRAAQPDKDRLSERICTTVFVTSEYVAARTVLFYLHVRNEVRTLGALPTALASGKRIVVPYCVGDSMQLFQLSSMEELAAGRYGILEPHESLRKPPERQVEAAVIDVALTPGVAFDRLGGRLGHGFGYFDRLLSELRPDAWIVALAYECQLFEEVPTAAHDVAMDKVVTEFNVYLGRRRRL